MIEPGQLYELIEDVKYESPGGLELEPILKGSIVRVLTVDDGLRCTIISTDGKTESTWKSSLKNEPVDKAKLVKAIEHYPGAQYDTDPILLLLDNTGKTLANIMLILDGSYRGEGKEKAVRSYIEGLAARHLRSVGDHEQAFELERSLSLMGEYYRVKYPHLVYEGIDNYWRGVHRHYQQKFNEGVRNFEYL